MVPPTFRNIQVNFCKNIYCDNFGVPPENPSVGAQDDRYHRKSVGAKSQALHCKACQQNPPIKSNAGIHEEFVRISRYLNNPSCTDTACANHGYGVDRYPDQYKGYGTTKSGSQRYQCRSCGKVFTRRKTSRTKRNGEKPSKNIRVFEDLMAGTALRKIARKSRIQDETLYDKIRLIHRKCLAFAGSRELRFMQNPTRQELNLSVDRQEYAVNWTMRADQRITMLTGLGVACNESKYVFGMHTNFDPDLNLDEVSQSAENSGDAKKQSAFRQYARAWLIEDYQQAIRESVKKPDQLQIATNVINRYKEALQRSDIESFDAHEKEAKLPRHGMLIHSEYTMYAFMRLLAEMFEKVGKVNFYMDQESAIRAAFLAAFKDRVLNRTADGFFVSIMKNSTMPDRRKAALKKAELIRSASRKFPGLSRHEVEVEILKQALQKGMNIRGYWDDYWLDDPLCHSGEPGRQICMLTDFGDYSLDRRAALFHKATLFGIDSFFRQVRENVQMLARPIPTASANRRLWYEYQAYNPQMVQILLDIYRVYYNYVQVGEDRKTPALRLGLARGVNEIEDILAT